MSCPDRRDQGTCEQYCVDLSGREEERGGSRRRGSVQEGQRGRLVLGSQVRRRAVSEVCVSSTTVWIMLYRVSLRMCCVREAREGAEGLSAMVGGGREDAAGGMRSPIPGRLVAVMRRISDERVAQVKSSGV